MRVVIDARSYGARHFSGIGRYIAELLAALEARGDPHEYKVLLCDLNSGAYAERGGAFPTVVTSARPYTFEEQLAVPRLLHRLRPDLVHFPANFGPLGFRGRRITTIHDLTMLEHPPHRSRGVRGRLDRWRAHPARLAMWHGARRSAGILADSHTTAEAVQRRYGIGSELFTVAYPGVRAPGGGTEQRPAAAPDGPFLLTVGLAYPHKNLHRLLEAFVELRNTRPQLQLVVVGRADGANAELRAAAERRAPPRSVVFTGYVTDGELRWLYRRATAYVFPSLAEGFGLPGLEAMAMGTPVIASSASCLPEVYGDAAAYCDASDSRRMAADIAAVIDDPALLSRLAGAGPGHAATYTWARTAAQTVAAYEAAAATRPAGTLR